MAKKILLIDDDVSLTEVYSQKLKAKGYEVVVSHDGLDGLQKAASEKPDLVLLDIRLPKLDGVMLFRKMNADQVTAKIPVILLTNVDEEDAVVECFKLGAIDYLIKSEMTPEKVSHKVAKFLSESGAE